jgi:thiol-disulfide isomerase/thioredoxin
MRWMIVLVVALTFPSCNKKEKTTKVDYDFIAFYFGKIYLEKIPLNDEEFTVLDSAEITYKTTHLSFSIPPQEESVFRLRMPGKPLRIYFINDNDHIVINGSSTVQGDYTFNNEGYNNHLKAFMDKQNKLIKEITPITKKAGNTSSIEEQRKLMQHADSLNIIYKKNAIAFADTTTSAGAFLFAYNSVDFGNDRKGLKEFIAKAGRRFPAHKNIQTLKKETLAYISIYEEELNIGDRMPPLELSDVNGTTFSATAVPGKYTFIDLWSTWCAPCINTIPVKKEAAKKFPAEKLMMVSIAVDAEKETWKQVVQQENLPGRHFIDEKMWRGKAAKAWKFDSIPFNFLVSPEGRILAKAIKPDSLLQVLDKFVK